MIRLHHEQLHLKNYKMQIITRREEYSLKYNQYQVTSIFSLFSIAEQLNSNQELSQSQNPSR